MQLENYIAGSWVKGTGKQAELLDASTGELIATTSSGGLDFGAMLTYAREVGGPPLRKMTFPERRRLCINGFLHHHRASRAAANHRHHRAQHCLRSPHRHRLHQR